jgi:hypothetical protein
VSFDFFDCTRTPKLNRYLAPRGSGGSTPASGALLSGVASLTLLIAHFSKTAPSCVEFKMRLFHNVSMFMVLAQTPGSVQNYSK